ncbi:carbonic anhydrase-2 [Coleophoma cylindrospora]|uniref:Carbonic anhydrase n=1 Tax=Coleophoma cylindrospora TaxID=1849047 RepID=A0A3D8SRQ2_9HELO|nr:carbonic anhydrase-2 [Coleophoma cylindrospora]
MNIRTHAHTKQQSGQEADAIAIPIAENDQFAYALSSNEAWAGYKNHQNPTFFPKLAAGQSPSILWLGCSDSRVPETTLLGLQPGDVFVHRNIANVISPTDINSSAVIEYAVAHLKVSHIVLCGHTCCGGAAAALGDSRVGGVLDTWLTPLKAIRRDHAEELAAIKDAGDRAIRLAELNVEKGVQNLLANYVVEEHIRTRNIKVHGVVYDIASGKIRDLRVGNASAMPGAGKEMAAPSKMEVLQGNHGVLIFKEGGSAMTVG